MLFRSDRKSTRLNSSHTIISYAVFCLKKKKQHHLHFRKTLFFVCRNDQRFCLILTIECVVTQTTSDTRSSIYLVRFMYFFFFLMIRRPPRSPLFPSPPLSRSRRGVSTPQPPPGPAPSIAMRGAGPD